MFNVCSFRASLGEACNADTTFVDSLEAFGGGQDDPVSVSIGGYQYKSEQFSGLLRRVNHLKPKAPSYFCLYFCLLNFEIYNNNSSLVVDNLKTVYCICIICLFPGWRFLIGYVVVDCC